MAEKVRVEKPRARAKETTSKQPIAQFSMAIASFEEGQHVDRMMGILSKQTLPKADFLVVISDNGSRGAWSIIEPESVITTKRLHLEKELGAKGLGNSFLTLLQEEEEARSLSLFTQHDNGLAAHNLQEVLTKRDTILTSITQDIPLSLQQQLGEYITLEDAQRNLLAHALQDPTKHIQEADTERPPRIPHQKPTREQQETVAAYARVLLGAYDDPEKDFRIALVQGSETGSFGSVKRFGLEAAKRDFSIHHPGKSVKEHVIMIGDMDTDVNEQFVGNVVNSFVQNPEKNALLVQPYAVNEKQDKHGKIQLRRSRLIPPPIPALFMDFTNMRSFIREHKRYPGQFLPKERGKSELFGYHLHPGPALIFRGDVFENQQQLLLQTDGQGEDIAATFRYQRLYGTKQTITDTSFGYGFNMRGHETKDYLKEFLAHPITFVKGIAGGRVRELVIPYQHRVLEQEMGEKPFHEFLQGINGYMKRKSLVGLLIREAEEQVFPQLAHTDYVVHRSVRMRGKALTPNIEKGERIIPGFNPITGNTEYALVRSAPKALHIHPDEFVIGEMSEAEEQAILKRRSFGERTEGVSFIDHRGREIPAIYHIQKKLEEKPITENDMVFAETLSTHNGRARRLASITPPTA